MAAREIDAAVTIRDALGKLDEYRGLWEVDAFSSMRELLLHREIKRTRAATVITARERDRIMLRAKGKVTDRLRRELGGDGGASPGDTQVASTTIARTASPLDRLSLMVVPPAP